MAGALPARAGSVDCAENSLGALTRRAERVALARVLGVSAAGVRLSLVRGLVGPPGELTVAPHDSLPGDTGARVLLFARQDPAGWQCLEAILLETPEQAEALAAAVATRLAGETQPLFEQLLADEPRVRRDAAIDLAAREQLAASPAQRASLLRALRERPGLELLALAERLAGPDLVEPLLAIARRAPHLLVLEAACHGLAASDPPRALRAVAQDLEDGAAYAVRALGFLGGDSAGRLLSEALEHADERAQRLAVLCALADARRCDAAAVARAVRQPRDPDEARLALAVLARCAEGRALRELQETLQPPLADLARALRRDPVDLALRTLRPAEEELARLAAEGPDDER